MHIKSDKNLSFAAVDWSKFVMEFPEGSVAGKAAGNGKQLLLCLHGFGNSRDLFDDLLQELNGLISPSVEDWTYVSIDLPLFGESHWHDPKVVMKPSFLNKLFEELKARFQAESCVILGFSLGAKLGIGLVQGGEKLPESMILLAPDGLKVHPLYRFCIYNPLGKRLFSWTVRRPGFFLFLIRSLYKLKIADAFKYRFVQRQFARKEDRELLKNVWHIYSGIRPDLSLLKVKSEGKRLSWHVIWGKKDTILPVKFGESFCKNIPRSKLYLLEGGHLLIQKNRKEVATLLEKILRDYEVEI